MHYISIIGTHGSHTHYNSSRKPRNILFIFFRQYEILHNAYCFTFAGGGNAINESYSALIKLYFPYSKGYSSQQRYCLALNMSEISGQTVESLNDKLLS